MAPSFASAELNLGYPLWASEFEPNNKDFLIVAGGGGESRSGVGNKIALLDASKKQDLSQVVDIELSRDEDSPTSLAVAQSTETSAVVFAGINSAEAEQKKGKNEHLRSFRIGLPTKRKRDADGTTGTATTAEKSTTTTPPTEALSKASLFRASPGDKNETYQRVLRLSPPVSSSNSRLGAIATGLAPAGEVVLFNASKPTPTANDVLQRVRLDNAQEAADIDIIAASASSTTDFLTAYCTSYEISIIRSSLSGKAKVAEPRLLYQTPIPDVFRDIKRPSFRALRFLTPRLLAAVINLPQRTGAEILLIDVPTSSALEGSVLLRKRFHKTMSSAVAFATTTLPGGSPTQNLQHVLAIAGVDRSVTVLTLDHAPDSNSRLRFGTHVLLKEALHMNLTSLSLSRFLTPSDPRKAPPQLLKLAATSMSGEVKIYTFPLTPYPASPAQNESQRYTLQPPGGGKRELLATLGSLFMALLLIALGTLAMQAFLEIRGGTPEYLGAKDWIGERGRGWLARPSIFEEGAPVDKGLLGRGKGRTAQKVEQVVEGAKDTAEEQYAKVREAARDAEEVIKEEVQIGQMKLTDALESILAAVPGESDSAEGKPEADLKQKAVVIKDDAEVGLSTEIHHDEDLVKKEHKRWEDLHEHERTAWKEKLINAGHWVEGQGEAVLKGVFFGELAGIVGEAIRG